MLCLIITGASNQEIAELLYISEQTVENHMTSILNRLNLRDCKQAAIFAKGVTRFCEMNPRKSYSGRLSGIMLQKVKVG